MPRHPSLIALSQDHHHGLALALKCRKQALGQLKPLGADGLKERADEVREFFSNYLEGHFRAEEQALFPAIRSLAIESDALVESLLQDHTDLRRAVTRFTDHANLSKTLFDLGDLLEKHIRREERELFPLFEQHVGGSEAERLKNDIERLLGRSTTAA